MATAAHTLISSSNNLTSPQVAFLDDNEDLRSVMVSLIESRLSVPCLSMDSVQALRQNAAAVLQTKIIVLDLDLGFRQPNGIDAYDWLLQNRYQGQVFFLTGHGKSDPLVMKAERLGARIWEKPIGSTSMLQQMEVFLRPVERPREVSL